MIYTESNSRRQRYIKTRFQFVWQKYSRKKKQMDQPLSLVKIKQVVCISTHVRAPFDIDKNRYCKQPQFYLLFGDGNTKTTSKKKQTQTKNKGKQ